ncbi:MAG TPA: hypothetical protein VGH20_17485 [Myxococcales bacterium]|jgi:hypothetical protein
MSNKSSTITSTEVRELLKNAARQLSAREEKALRMRNGASVDMQTPLPQRGQDNAEARAELLALEIELKQKLAARSPSGVSVAPRARSKAELPSRPTAERPVKTKEKDKIIRALRRLK